MADERSFLASYKNGDISRFFANHSLQKPRPLPRTLDRSALVAALSQYAKKLAAPEAVFRSLERLAEHDAYAVVTGQQAGLLLGPSYTLSKAVSAINLAASLSTDVRPVVPIFWVASQDHDTEEINHTYVLDFDETLKRLELPLPVGMPSGRIPFEEAYLSQLFAQLETLTVKQPHLAQVKALLHQAAETSESFADFFASLLYLLLGHTGLVVLNPLEPEIAQLFRPIMEYELKDPLASAKHINEAGRQLDSLGYSPQLGRGEAASNLFLEEPGGHITRNLLRFDKQFYTDSASYSIEDLQGILDHSPSRITPAAGLRPITQDSILPTLATVVGPGELKYFAQLKPVYAMHKIEMPYIFPRMTATVLEPPVKRILKKFDLSYEAYINRPERHKESIVLKLHGHGKDFHAATVVLEQQLTSLLEHVKSIDPSLVRTVVRAETYLDTTLDILRSKTAKALMREDDIYTLQLNRLEAHLLPLGNLQERMISPFSFFLKFGLEPVLQAFLNLPPEGDHLLEF